MTRSGNRFARGAGTARVWVSPKAVASARPLCRTSLSSSNDGALSFPPRDMEGVANEVGCDLLYRLHSMSRIRLGLHGAAPTDLPVRTYSISTPAGVSCSPPLSPLRRRPKRPLFIAKHDLALSEHHKHIRMMVMSCIDELHCHRYQIGIVSRELGPEVHLRGSEVFWEWNWPRHCSIWRNACFASTAVLSGSRVTSFSLPVSSSPPFSSQVNILRLPKRVVSPGHRQPEEPLPGGRQGSLVSSSPTLRRPSSLACSTSRH
jgi:hypothetical protein